MERRRILAGSVGALSASVAGCNLLAAPPSFELRDLEPGATEIGQGRDLTLTVTVVNSGGRAGEAELDVLAGGETRETVTAAVEADAERTVETSVDTSALEPGDHEVGFRAGAEEPVQATTTVTVLQPATFAFTAVDPVSGNRPRGETVELTATVENVGEVEGTAEVVVRFDGRVETTEWVTLGPGESTEISYEQATSSVPTGEYDFAFEAGDESIGGTLTVREPRPDPVVTNTAMPDPTFRDLSQQGNRFLVTVVNDGNAGDLGYGLVFFDDGQHRWDSDVEVQGQDTAHFQAGQEREVSETEEPGDETYFAFRLWPAEVTAEVENEGPGDGTIAVELLNGSSVVSTQEVVVAAGESTPVTFQPDFSEDQPQGISVEARLPE